MDYAVAGVYDWINLDLGHGFYTTKQGIRYTMCETARRKLLDLLLTLNHERRTEEVAKEKVFGVPLGVNAKRRSTAGTLEFPDEDNLFNEDGVEA